MEYSPRSGITAAFHASVKYNPAAASAEVVGEEVSRDRGEQRLRAGPEHVLWAVPIQIRVHDTSR